MNGFWLVVIMYEISKFVYITICSILEESLIHVFDGGELSRLSLNYTSYHTIHEDKSYLCCTSFHLAWAIVVWLPLEAEFAGSSVSLPIPIVTWVVHLTIWSHPTIFAFIHAFWASSLCLNKIIITPIILYSLHFRWIRWHYELESGMIDKVHLWCCCYSTEL